MNIEIHYGRNKNAWLSNLAERHFVWKGTKYMSVEMAYQTLKSGSFDKNTYNKYMKFGGYGIKLRGKRADRETNLGLMYQLIVSSFCQNYDLLEKLRTLKGSTFYHNSGTPMVDNVLIDALNIMANDGK